MINILVPTDFTTDSLQLAEAAIRSLEGQKANILLFHAFELPYFYQDLLADGNRPYLGLMNDDLRQACKKLKDDYPKQVGKVLLKFMHGNSVAAFKNFIEANKIDVVYCPPLYVYEKIHRRSVNPVQLFKKSGVKQLIISSNEKSQLQKQELPVAIPAFLNSHAQ